MSDKLFVVIWQDPNNDDSITLHRTLDGANAKVDEYKTTWPDEEWVEMTPLSVFGTATTDRWLRYVRAESDNSASIFIHEMEIEQ